jgi:hypothetical protein
MSLNTVSTNRIRITFSIRPFAVKEITNLITGRRMLTDGIQTILIRTPLELFQPTITDRLKRTRAAGDRTEFLLTDETGAYSTTLSVGASRNGLRFHLQAKAPRPIWLVEWRLSGWKLDEMIVPALGGQSLSREMPEETTLSYKYPFWWMAQFVVGAQERGGMWIRSMEKEPRLKLLRVRKDRGSFTLTYGFEAGAPIVSKTLEAEWYVDCFAGSWREPVRIHRQWLEEEFQLKPRWNNPHFPAWLKDINFVLEMWGVTKDRVEPLHTYDQMRERLRQWKKIHSPKNTLVYLPGFAEHGIDSRAPDYNPSPYLGGERKFKQLVDEAHRMGYRIMVHTNVLAMTFTHRLYPKFKKYQVVDPWGRLQGWGLDMDGDWLAEPYFAYMNPGYRAWGDLMTTVIGKLIHKFNVDGVFLDQTLLAFNVSKGPNFLHGMRRHIQRLQRAFPHVLFGGEGLHEHVVAALPFAQIHGIDSIAEVHGMEGNIGWRQAHPVATYLFGPYTTFVAHLLTKHPSNPVFKLQERAYAKLGVIPALCLYNYQQALKMPEVRAMVKRAKRIQQE